jgi:hypothetical protein
LNVTKSFEFLIHSSTKINFQIAKEKVSRLVHSIQIEPLKEINCIEDDEEQDLATEFTEI